MKSLATYAVAVAVAWLLAATAVTTPAAPAQSSVPASGANPQLAAAAIEGVAIPEQGSLGMPLNSLGRPKGSCCSSIRHVFFFGPRSPEGIRASSTTRNSFMWRRSSMTSVLRRPIARVIHVLKWTGQTPRATS